MLEQHYRPPSSHQLQRACRAEGRPCSVSRANRPSVSARRANPPETRPRYRHNHRTRRIPGEMLPGSA
jgi:hypothetical protein